MQVTAKPRNSQTWHIRVKGTDWRYRLLSPKNYLKVDPDDNCAVTDSVKNIMYFRTDDLAWGHCIHELFHAFVAELHLNSADLSKIGFEEIVAEMLERHAREMVDKATKMHDRMAKSRVSKE